MSIVEFISMHDLRFWIEHLRKQFPEIVEHETVLLIDQLANNEFPNEVYEGIKKCNA